MIVTSTATRVYKWVISEGLEKKISKISWRCPGLTTYFGFWGLELWTLVGLIRSRYDVGGPFVSDLIDHKPYSVKIAKYLLFFFFFLPFFGSIIPQKFLELFFRAKQAKYLGSCFNFHVISSKLQLLAVVLLFSPSISFIHIIPTSAVIPLL